MIFLEAFLAATALYAIGGAVVARVAWRLSRPAPDDPAEVPDLPILQWEAERNYQLTQETDVIATCGICLTEIEVPAPLTALTRTGSWWTVTGVCPVCSSPWESRHLTAIEANVMRSVGVVDAEVALAELREFLDADDRVRAWLSP